jgi:hypothetical protein
VEFLVFESFLMDYLLYLDGNKQVDALLLFTIASTAS